MVKKILSFKNNNLFFLLLFVFLFLNINAQTQDLKKNSTSSQNDLQEILLKKQETLREVQKPNDKPELKIASKSNSSNSTPNRNAILAKIAYLKEQACCEEEILEMESKLDN